MIINPYVYAAGGGGTTPSAIPNIWDWWEPSRDTYANNDPMGTLTGQFAAHNFTATGANRPIYTTNVLNSLAVSTHTGSSLQGWAGVNPSALTAAHLFIVVRTNNDPAASDGVAGLWSWGVAVVSTLYPRTSDSHVFDEAASDTFGRDVGNPATSLTAWNVYEVVSTTTEWTALLNGTQLFTTGTNTVRLNTNCQLGTSSGAKGVDGQIAGMYLFSAKLTTDRATMVTYLNTRFGLSIV